MNLCPRLAHPKLLWASFGAMIVCLCVIQFLVFRFDLILLDMLSDPAQVKSAILSMSAQQLRIHIGITATLDVALPLAYGFFSSAWPTNSSRGGRDFYRCLPFFVCP